MNLNELIEQARNYQPTPEEREAQRRSFAYGNCAIENPAVTRDLIDWAAEGLEAERD